jgi:prevent-host-death family protein
MNLQIGIRQLRSNLSQYISQAHLGAELVITDRGIPVARLTPYEMPNTLERLVAEGRVTPARSSKPPLSAPFKATGTVSDLVAEQRE